MFFYFFYIFNKMVTSDRLRELWADTLCVKCHNKTKRYLK